ncbi:ATP-dependent dethiobiotin synthetase BioD [Novosphingobium marinum]|uniref:ATP-dependent dethiobiotin synthetase BioD n=1 Tax=Novosphingobium marinum TaxID=1514948 RepID=A0A7Y9XY93_9SPHN|nr:dethiobiotin synthase [Novosphingobium marinum]NYH96804.1 dethiobiotin synthetase [Novosphingobium marinum]GGC40107.1 ATP-dependent dethiobiotin synthetase BioD [Novosphingobium marinum]
MSAPAFVVTGTDTGVGKTVFAAALTAALGASYWKPVQAGLDADGRGDSAEVARLAGLSDRRILPESYVLHTPCSPHLAAEIDRTTIVPERLALPETDGPLVIEGAGGALVPLTRSLLYADVFAHWQVPAIIVARTALGTINHSLLTIEALRARAVPIHGIAFVGDANEDSEATICEMGEVARLGRLPRLERLEPTPLAIAFSRGFRMEDFGA